MAPTRVRIDHILCPTDFSEFSVRALRRAVTLARWFGARVTVLHVVSPTSWGLPGDAYGVLVAAEADITLQRRTEKENLAHFVEPFLDQGTAIETKVVEGEPWREIRAVAQALPADLVVMGTHGRSGFEHLLLGSVTEKVLRRAPCPVLTVGHPDETVSPGPLFRRILCAVDLTRASEATLDMALSLAEENLARVTLLHVVEGQLGEGGPDLGRPVPATALRRALIEEARERLHQASPPAYSYCPVTERVETGAAWQAIVEVAQETSADLIVMGAHARGAVGRLFLGSTANQVVRHGPCPVLLVREMEPSTESPAGESVGAVQAHGLR